jgi:succinyl-CoA synthetase alpha subunit
MDFTFNSRVMIMGITEPLSSVYVPVMKTYGTQIVAGVSAGFGGQTVCGVPVFDMVSQALAQKGIVETAILFVQPYEVLDAALEAIAAGIRQLVIVTEGVPPLDMVSLVRQAEITETLVVGANCPGIIVPGQILLGTHPPAFYMPGHVGVISRSGALGHEVAWELTQAGLGQSIAVGIGSDRISGSSFQQWLQILEEDEQTEVIVLVGERAGDGEALAAHYIAEAIDKPVVAYIAGHMLPKSPYLDVGFSRLDPQNRLDFAEDKIAAFQQANVSLADRPSQIPSLVRRKLWAAQR